MFSLFRRRIFSYGLVGAFVILWSIGLGTVPLYDWDEVNFAECAREMRLSGEYLYAQIGFLPFWEKPPLFFWVQALSMSLWGENALAARFPNLIISALTLLTLYEIGRRWHGHSFGVAWLLLYGVSLLPSFYARSGLIDPLFNLLMLWSLLFGLRALDKSGWGWAILFGAMAALATLTKGPVGLLLPSLAIGTWGLWQRIFFPTLRLAVLGGATFALIVGGWIALLYARGTETLLREFWAYQWRLFSTPDAGHSGPWYYHLVVLSLGMFPASAWALGARGWKHFPKEAYGILFLTAWTILIFSVVKTKIIHYSSLAYYGIAYLGAWTWHYRRSWIRGWGWTVCGVASFLLGFLTIIAGIVMTQTHRWLRWLKDPFAQAAISGGSVSWSGWEGWMGFLLIGGVSFMLILRVGQWGRFFGLAVMLSIWEALTLGTFAPRAELYSQAPLRRFCMQAASEGITVWSLGFKSYIPYFYGGLRPEFSPGSVGSVEAFQNLLLSGDALFPAVFVSRVDRYKPFVDEYRLEIIRREGGYVFLRARGSADSEKANLLRRR
ncbi:MAG: glycosyltransferase family 39 protein [Bacteroidia bacterium]|nr:glycosyltransferase family 39 protein [Bacteroidia bacterium]